MTDNDLRWLQRFDNFQRALLVLERGVRLAQSRELSELEQQGLIQGFAFTHELAWNLLKDYLTHQGVAGVVGSRDAARLAFQNGLISDLGRDPSEFQQLVNGNPFGTRLRHDVATPMALEPSPHNAPCADLLSHGAALIR